MKKVLIGLLALIPILIVAAVILVTEVILLTPDISVESVEIVDEYQVKQESVEVQSFYSGMQYQLFADVRPRKANNKTVHWSIDLDGAIYFNPDEKEAGVDIATVSTDGLVTIYTTGTFDVVLTSDDGGHTSRCTFIVFSHVATEGYIVYNSQKTDETGDISVKTDEIVKLDACARPTDIKIEYVRWTSSDESIVKVDNNGVLVPQGVGSAIITMVIKSYDRLDTSGNVIMPAAAELMNSVRVNVTSGVFGRAAVNFCYDTVYNTDGAPHDYGEISLSALGYGASGSTLGDGATNCTLENGVLKFTSTEGVAYLVKGGSMLTVYKYTSNKILFENQAQLAGSTIIIGKIPYYLNVVSALTEKAPEEELEFFSSDESVATVDENGAVTALSEGTVTIMAQLKNNIDSRCQITFNVREPVIYFVLEQDTHAGIARERIYGNYWYDSSRNMTLTRPALKILRPQLDNSRFNWEITEGGDIASIDENGAITLLDSFEGERTIVVTVTAKDSPYAVDEIRSTYSFTVRQGINVTNAWETKNAAELQTQDLFVQADVTFATTDIVNDFCLTLFTDMYGNGHLFRYSQGNTAEEKAGRKIIKLRGDDVVLSNLRIQSGQMGDSFTKTSYTAYCVEMEGNNTRVEFCHLENAENAIRVSTGLAYIEGCVMNNTSKFALFTWVTRYDQHEYVKNCIFGTSAVPSIGLSSGVPIEEFNVPNEEGKCKELTLHIEGFCDMYNWKQSVDMELVGGITGDATVDNMINGMINSELNSGAYDQYFRSISGVKYMHAGIMFNGFLNPCNIKFAGNEAERYGLDMLKIEIAKVGGGIGQALGGTLYDIYLYSYVNDGPISPLDRFPSLNDEVSARLRGETI